jgi:hypothetical protein
MEFLDMNLAKDLSLLLHAIKKKCAKQENSRLIVNSILKKGKNEGRKNQTKLESQKTQVYGQKPRLKMPFKSYISEPSLLDTLIQYNTPPNTSTLHELTSYSDNYDHY